MSSLDDFHCASYERKCDLVTHFSNYIAYRVSNQHKIYLYHTGSFFIEVYYSPQDQYVAEIQAFSDDISRMEPYVEMVSLEELGY